MSRHWTSFSSPVLDPELLCGTKAMHFDYSGRFNRRVSVVSFALFNILHCPGIEKLAISSQPETVLSLETKSHTLIFTLRQR